MSDYLKEAEQQRQSFMEYIEQELGHFQHNNKTREEVMWYTTRCAYCLQHRPAPTTIGRAQPIQSQSVGDQVQVDLIEMRNSPSGKYKWILHTHDHKSRFHTLWPLFDKSAPAMAEVMTYWLAAGHQMKIWQSDNGGEFKGALLPLMRTVHLYRFFHGPFETMTTNSHSAVREELLNQLQGEYSFTDIKP